MSSSSSKIFFGDYAFNVSSTVYKPAEDSFLFAENLAIADEDFVLDMGTGCGLLGIMAADKASCVVATDINPFAVRCAKENAILNHVANRLHFIQGDLFSPIRVDEKFDLIVFNAPYLPVNHVEEGSWLERAWAGGIDGRLVVDRFIAAAPKHLRQTGRVLLLQSSLCGIDETLQKLGKMGLKANVVAERDLQLFETIALLEATY